MAGMGRFRQNSDGRAGEMRGQREGYQKQNSMQTSCGTL